MNYTIFCTVRQIATGRLMRYNQTTSKNKLIIIIRGAPASGKSTLAKNLVRTLKRFRKTSLLIPDEFKWVMTAHDNRDQRDFNLAFSNYLYVLKNYLNAGYNIITEDTWDQAPFETKKVKSLAQKYKYTCIQILLKGGWEIIKHQNTLRPMILPQKQLRQQYSSIYKHIEPNEIIININNKTPTQITKETLKYIFA
jgi:predicted kinase